ncbi:MAG: ABC transporter substrate-binding protein, partial [Desulfobacterales bacterium]|nr:ABC transporter substrate-binding protein [Desulfobacterales bacterium]
MKKAFHRPGSIFLAIVLLFTAAPFARSHETFEKVSIQLQWRHQFEFAGFYAAKEKGCYRDVGLDVEIREYNSGADIMESVLSGEATFGLLHGEVIRARMRGKSVILLANYFKRSPMALAVQPDILYPEELKGRIVMGEKHEIESSNFAQMFQQFNMTTDDFTVVPHTFTTDKFINGEVDAMVLFLTNEVYRLGQEKAPFNIIDPNNYGVPLYDVNLFTAEAYADENPGVVRAFTDASNKGWAYALEHPAEIIDLILEKYNSQGKSKPHLLFEARETRRIMLPDIYPIGSIDPNRIRRMEELFVLEGLADAIVEPESFIFGMDGHEKSLFTPGEKAFIKNHPTVRVVRSFHQPPFAVHQEGRLTGYLYDLLSEVLSLAGLKAEYVGGF